jgi:hypothetical protein
VEDVEDVVDGLMGPLFRWWGIEVKLVFGALTSSHFPFNLTAVRLTFRDTRRRASVPMAHGKNSCHCD